jgi:hypothetical protein
MMKHPQNTLLIGLMFEGHEPSTYALASGSAVHYGLFVSSPSLLSMFQRATWQRRHLVIKPSYSPLALTSLWLSLRRASYTRNED